MSDRKRKCPNLNEGGSKKVAGHWSQGLLASMNDPQLKVDEDDLTVTIKDKYPKAKYHFLVIPKEGISSISKLERKHIPLLEHMQERGEELSARTSTSATFQFGYHAVPSMSQIHLHVISQDFDSVCLKNKKHWNSFTTEYFVNSSDLIGELKENGSVSYDPVKYAELLKRDLRCHICSKSLATIPALKEHLKNHNKPADGEKRSP